MDVTHWSQEAEEGGAQWDNLGAPRQEGGEMGFWWFILGCWMCRGTRGPLAFISSDPFLLKKNLRDLCKAEHLINSEISSPGLTAEELCFSVKSLSLTNFHRVNTSDLGMLLTKEFDYLGDIKGFLILIYLDKLLLLETRSWKHLINNLSQLNEIHWWEDIAPVHNLLKDSYRIKIILVKQIH